ncbi:MAG: hypothetical protein M1818_002791 [Claussenomyces sp. TS43310]|nr:MAG: hypothetical protein M1818_002791 [Claussenomyces sp. TS43310]
MTWILATSLTYSRAPNDEQQNNELDIAHHLYLVVLRNRLFLAPIGDNPQKVLDVGTGTGIWAIDFADQYPSAEVIGFDLSPIQPTWVPPNVRFEINDACSHDWAYPRNSFDFIHVRAMYGSVADWPAFYQQVMVPGGYIEQVELSVDPTSDDGTVTPDNIFAEWGRMSLDLGESFGKTLRIHELMEDYLREAGFEDVVLEKFKMPIGPWSKDPYLKQVGMWNMLDWQEGIEGWCVGLLSRVKGWSYTEIQAYLGRVRAGLKDRKIHAWQSLKIVHARKPLDK